MIAENLAAVQRRIAETCLRCGRAPGDVRLVAVSKTFSAEAIAEAALCGQIDFGENYAQELKTKSATLAGRPLRWHFIGHLQSNKVKMVADVVTLVHSIDSLSAVEELEKRAERLGRPIPILVEVHTTDEATKSGVLPSGTMEFVKQASRFRSVPVRGLMTMGPFADDPNDSRPAFRQLAELRQRIAEEGIDGVEMRDLSMGMTHDFEVGIEEGATLVRIGTAIFGKRTVLRGEG